MRCSLMNLAITAPDTFLIGIASTHFVYIYVALMIHSLPFEFGNINPMQSMPHVWKGHEVVVVLKSTAGAWIRFPWIWYK